MNREIEKIYCSCQYNQNNNFSLIESTVIEMDCTNEENTILGCGKENCCTSAFQCSACGTRFSFQLAAPEYRG